MPYQDLPNELPAEPSDCKKAVHAALVCGQKRMDMIEGKLDENTVLTQEVVEILRAGKGGLKVLGWIGTALKWGAGVAGAIYTIYCIWKGRNPFL